MGVIVKSEAIEIAGETETQTLPQPASPRRKRSGSNGSEPFEIRHPARCTKQPAAGPGGVCRGDCEHPAKGIAKRPKESSPPR